MMLNEQSNQSFSDFIAPIKIALDRYWRIAWPPAIVVIVLGLFLSVKLAPYYSADVLISNQQQRMNSKLVVSPSKEDQNERLQSLIFEVISRPRLSNILDQYPIYPRLKGAKLKDDALKKLKESLEITPEDSTTGQKLNQTFRLSFSHSDPQLAYQVTKAISDLFIDESMLNTKIETEGTVEFIDTKLREARQQLEATEKAVQDFQKQNFGKLPDDFQSTDARLKSAQSQLATNSQMIIAKTEKLNFLRREMQLVSKEVPPGGGTSENISDPESGVMQLESALVVLRSKYSDEHPDVISTRKRLEALRARIAGSKTGKADEDLPKRGNAETRSVRRAIGDLEAELSALSQENVNLKNTLVQLENNIKDMPIRAPDLIKIKRDYANVKDNYEKLLAARQDAELQKDLISSQKATQFRIVDPPSVPTIPDGPPRLIIASVAVLIGLILFFSVAIGTYFSSDSFKFKEEIESELGIAVLGVVPPIATQTAGINRQKAINMSMLLSIASMIAGFLLIIIFTY